MRFPMSGLGGEGVGSVIASGGLLVEHTELRVHGVSGTPPRDMLYTDPVTSDPETEHTRVYRRRPLDITRDAKGGSHAFEAEAFHWGSLTTGSVLTAFWILLGPFAFANVAGWMTTRPRRSSHLGIRLAGMTSTALFVAQLGYLFLEIPLFAVRPSWAKETLLATTLVFLLLFVIGLGMRLSTQTHFDKDNFTGATRFLLTLSPKRVHLLPPIYWQGTDPPPPPPEQWDDPVGSPITADPLWIQHSILHRIRRIHLALGVLVITRLIAIGMEATWLAWATLIGAAGLALLMGATTIIPRSRAVQMLTAWAPAISLAMFAVAYGLLAAGNPPTDLWTGYHQATFDITLLLGAGGLAALLSGWVGMGAFVIGTLFGASLSTGLGFLAEQLVGEHKPTLTERGAGWVAVAMFMLVIVIGITILLLSLVGADRLPEEGKLMAMLRNITARARWVFRVAAGYGIVFGAVTIWVGCIQGACTPESLTLPQSGGLMYKLAIAAFSIMVLLAGIRVYSTNRWLSMVVVVAGGVLVWLFAVGLLREVSIAGVEIFSDLVAVSKGFVIILPGGLILRSMCG
ncbi:MAG: hypothetical protein M3P87_07750, partial [Actinomycetota bacterium]|nr:hypothetical protein [Actinomycetota bacterium]